MTFPTSDGAAAADKVLTFRKRRLSLPLHHLAPDDDDGEPGSPSQQAAAVLAPPLLPPPDEQDKAHTFRKRRLSLTLKKPLASHHEGGPGETDALGSSSEGQHYAPKRRRSSAGSAASASSTERQHPSRTLHASELLHDTSPAVDNILYHQKPLPAPEPQVPAVAASFFWNNNSQSTTEQALNTAPTWKRRHTHVEEHKLPFSKDIVGTYSCHGVEPVYESDYDDNTNEWDAAPEEEATSEQPAASVPSQDAPTPQDGQEQQPTQGEPPSRSSVEALDSTTTPTPSATTTSTSSTTEESAATTASASTATEESAPPVSSSKPTTVAKINQDRGGVAFPYGNSPHTALFGVYDGHGQGGELVSQFCLSEVQRRLEKHKLFETDLETAFREVFLTVDAALTREPLIEPLFAGTTACVALLRGQTLTCANAGDSRAVIARRNVPTNTYDALEMTLDQTPDLPGEQQRIQQMGGHVSPPPAPGLSARVWLDAQCTQIGLAMARSIGDHAVSTVGVIADPIVTQHEVDEHDEILLMASDGVWEFLSSQQAVDIVMSNLDKGATKACQALIEAAADKWHEEEGDYRDDITALVVRLQHLWDDEKSDKATSTTTKAAKEDSTTG